MKSYKLTPPITVLARWNLPRLITERVVNGVGYVAISKVSGAGHIFL